MIDRPEVLLTKLPKKIIRTKYLQKVDVYSAKQYYLLIESIMSKKKADNLDIGRQNKSIELLDSQIPLFYL